MYGFSQIGDEQLLVGLELIQVCIGSNEVILRFFPDGNSVTCYDVQGFAADNASLFEPLIGMSKRIRQIGKVVTRFEVRDNHTAAVTFSDGAEIILKDDSEDYEAVTFQCGSRTVVV